MLLFSFGHKEMASVYWATATTVFWQGSVSLSCTCYSQTSKICRYVPKKTYANIYKNKILSIYLEIYGKLESSWHLKGLVNGVALHFITGCERTDLVLVPNVTTAVNCILRSQNLQKGETVYRLNIEYGKQLIRPLRAKAA